MTILVLGDGNLERSADRAARAGVRLISIDHPLDMALRKEGEMAVLLGTEREQRAMAATFRLLRLKEGQHYTAAPPSRNTVENAKSAAFVVELLGSRDLLIVTHAYHENPLPGVGRVTRIFTAQFPGHEGYTVELDLIRGMHPKQRALQMASVAKAVAMNATAARGGIVADVAGSINDHVIGLREAVRNRADSVLRSQNRK